MQQEGHMAADVSKGTTGDLRQLAVLIAVALANRRVTDNKNQLINCVSDFATLMKLRVRYLEKFHRELDISADVPGVLVLLDLVQKEDFLAAVIEASRIRKEIAPVLRQAKERLKGG